MTIMRQNKGDRPKKSNKTAGELHVKRTRSRKIHTSE